MNWASLLTGMRAMPAWAWRLVAGVGVLGAVVGSLYVAERAVRQSERATVLQEASAVRRDSLTALRIVHQLELDALRARVRRLGDSVRVEVRSVAKWTPLVPDSIRQRFAAVDSLVRACTRLARDCDSLRVATTRVDTLIDTLRVIDTTATRSLQLALVQRDGRIAALESKSCVVPTAVGSGLGAVLGYLTGRAR